MKKSTFIRSILLCGLSMLLCISMLAGSTFAWFTDEVKSGNNTIMAGNLDVELYNGSVEITGEATDPKFFDEVQLWEPGAMAIETFTVKNAGDLALKYSLEFNVSAPTTGVSLAEALKIAVVEGELTTSGRIDPANYQWQPFASFALSGELDLTSAEETSDTVTFIVWWEPSDNDNDYNMNNGATDKASIDFSLVLKATQLDAEDDAFGPDYDAGAPILSAPVALPAAGTATAPVTVVASDVKVEIPADVINALPAEVTSIAISYTAPKVDANTGVVSFNTVELVDQDGNEIDLSSNATPVAVTLPAQTALAAGQDVVIMHDGVIVDTATVAADGSISYEANHFCEVTVVAVTKVATADELKAAVANGGNIMFTADIALSEILVINNDNTAIYGMGYTLTSTATRAINVSGANGVTINGLTIVASGERAINVIQNATNVTIVGVTATAANYSVNVASSAPNAVVAIKNSTLNGLCTVNVSAEGSKVTVDDSTVNCNDNNATKGEAYAALSLNVEAAGGSIIATNTTVNVVEGSDSIKGRNSTIDGTVIINGSTDDVALTVAVITYPGSPYYHGFFTLENAVEFAKETDTITLIRDIVLTKAITLDGDVKLDLNGYTISGVCNAGQGYLIGVNNGVTFTVSDSSEEQTGKITYASGTSNTGWTIKVDGNLVLNSGTIELTGDWSIGYAIDLRPNSWSPEFTQASTVTINGGKLVSSDGGIRVASSSSEKHTKVAANLVMNGGEIVAAFDGIFVQQSDAIYDVLNVTLNNGKVTAALYPVRFYGPNATSVVGNVEKPMTFTITNTELVLNGEVNANATWYVDGQIVIGGGMTVENFENYTTTNGVK